MKDAEHRNHPGSSLPIPFSSFLEKIVSGFLLDRGAISILGAAFIVILVTFLPYLTQPLFSIDDYYLYQVYDINIQTMWYNFYSTGRPVEGLFAQLFYYLNIQPLVRPLGPLLFLAAVTFFCLQASRTLGVTRLGRCATFGFVVIAATTPFLAEVLQFSAIPAYSSAAVLFLALGLVFATRFAEAGSFSRLALSSLFYAASLATYQIFYTMVMEIVLLSLLIPLIAAREESSEGPGQSTARGFKLLVPYAAGFVLYFAVLKVCYALSPPAMDYAEIGLGQALSSLTSYQYWGSVYSKLHYFTMQNNSFNSVLVNAGLVGMVVIAVLSSILLSITEKRERWLWVAACSLAGTALYVVVGHLVSIGFAFFRLGQIGSRTFVAFGVYQAGLMLCVVLLLRRREKLLRGGATALVVVFLAVVVSNMGRSGRMAVDQYRLNTVDRSLATRIVARLEADEHFSSTAKVVLWGTAPVGAVWRTWIGDYNVSALQHYSRVFVLNEVSGCTFGNPRPQDVERARQLSLGMEAWPRPGAVRFVEDMFIVKLSN